MLFRRERAGNFIKEELTLLLRKEVRDPRVASITITDVDLTRDRRIARVYVASYSGKEALDEGLRGLASATGFLRRHLGQVLHWRLIPELEFRADTTWEKAERIDALLKQLAQERDDATGDDGPVS